MNVEVAIMTCPREPVYITRLLETMFARQDMANVRTRVVVDHHEPSHLGAWAEDPRIELDVLAEPPAEALGDPNRIFRTFRRCVDGARGDVSLVLLQEDALVSANWLERAIEGEELVRKEIAHIPGQQFFVALYSTMAMGGGRVHFMLPSYYFGTVGVLFPVEVLLPLREYCKTIPQDTPDDMAVKRYAIENGIRVYNLNPSVVQHIGAKSTHVTWDMTSVKSPTFRDA